VATPDGRALREHWDATTTAAAGDVRRALRLAEERGDGHVVRYLTTALSHLVRLQLTVDAQRTRPGERAPGLVYDAPDELWEPPYVAAGQALDTVTRLFTGGLGATGWDWSQGFPPGWPTSLGDRVRSYAPARIT
jgi:hypothetical protein